MGVWFNVQELDVVTVGKALVITVYDLVQGLELGTWALLVLQAMK